MENENLEESQKILIKFDQPESLVSSSRTYAMLKGVG